MFQLAQYQQELKCQMKLYKVFKKIVRIIVLFPLAHDFLHSFADLHALMGIFHVASPHSYALKEIMVKMFSFRKVCRNREKRNRNDKKNSGYNEATQWWNFSAQKSVAC